MEMITNILTQEGQTKSVRDAFTALININPTDKYKKQKAAGFLGGSSSSVFFNGQEKTYTRTR